MPPNSARIPKGVLPGLAFIIFCNSPLFLNSAESPFKMISKEFQSSNLMFLTSPFLISNFMPRKKRSLLHLASGLYSNLMCTSFSKSCTVFIVRSPFAFGSITRLPSFAMNRILPASVLPSRGSLVLFIFQPEKSLPLKSKVNPESALGSAEKSDAAKSKPKAVAKKDFIENAPLRIRKTKLWFPPSVKLHG